MSTCPICNIHREPFRFAPISYTPGEKLAFVERVCGLLVQSRYGMDRVYENLAGPRCEIEDDPGVFFADEKTFKPPHPTGTLHRLLEKIKTAASLSAEKLKNSGTQLGSPSTLGRGSPSI